MRTVLILTTGLLGALVVVAPAQAASAADCTDQPLREVPCTAALPPCTEPAAPLEPCEG